MKSIESRVECEFSFLIGRSPTPDLGSHRGSLKLHQFMNGDRPVFWHAQLDHEAGHHLFRRASNLAADLKSDLHVRVRLDDGRQADAVTMRWHGPDEAGRATLAEMGFEVAELRPDVVNLAGVTDLALAVPAAT